MDKLLALVGSRLVDALLISGIFFLALCVTGLLSLCCDRLGGKFAQAVKPQGHKLESLEGLRGVLALAVVAHHCSCWYGLIKTGVWAGGPIFSRLGGFGVMPFFFISGFLFWRKLMKGPINLKTFYLSRLARIGPVYFACIILAFCVGSHFSGWELRQTGFQLFTSAASWATFSIFGQPLLNGIDLSRVVSGVVWTLGLEWIFYLCLPFFDWFARQSVRIIHFLLLMAALFLITKGLSITIFKYGMAANVLFYLHGWIGAMLVAGFGGGILLATLHEWIAPRLRLSSSAKNWLVVTCYGIYLFTPDFRGSAVLGVSCLLIAFALVLQGSDIFGFLKFQSTRFLGLISYDLYLVHGVILYTEMQLRRRSQHVSAVSYIAETAASIVVIVLLATLVHASVEVPSMRLSERLGREALPTVSGVLMSAKGIDSVAKPTSLAAIAKKDRHTVEDRKIPISYPIGRK